MLTDESLLGDSLGLYRNSELFINEETGGDAEEVAGAGWMLRELS